MKPLPILFIAWGMAFAGAPLAPPGQLNWPMTVIKVSTIIPAADASAGCRWDLGTNLASSACANDITYIDACLNGTAKPSGAPPNWPSACVTGATLASGIDLVFDVGVGIGACVALPVPSNVILEGQGMLGTGGIFVLSGSNATAIGNVVSGGYCSAGLWSGTAPARYGSAVIRNLPINANRGTFPNGNSNQGDSRCATSAPYYGWCTGIALANLNYLEVNGVQVINSPTYGIDISNIGLAVGRVFSAKASSLSDSNTDGFHMDGLVDWFDLDGLFLAGGDDCIAANPAEGYPGNSGGGAVGNVQYGGCLAGFRTYCNGGAGNYTLGPVTETNLSGILANHTAIDRPRLLGLGLNGTGSAECIQSVKVTNADVTAQDYTFDLLDPVMVDISDPVGDVELTNVRWHSPVGAGTPWLMIREAVTLSNYVCNLCTIYRDGAGSSPVFWATIPSGATVKRYECAGCTVVNATGNSTAALAYGIDLQSGGAITNFIVPKYDPLAPTVFNGSQWSRVTNILGQNGMGYPMASISACTSAALGAGALAGGGTITGTPTGSCAAVLTTQVPAPNKFLCQVNNMTHPGATNTVGQASGTATTCTLQGTTISGDVLNFSGWLQ